MIEALAGTLAYVVERLRSCHRSGCGRRNDGAGRWPGVERSDVGDASVPGDQAVGLCAHGRQHPPDWFGDGVCFVKFLWAVSAFLLVRLSGCF